MTDYDPTLSIRGNADKFGISRRQAKKRKDYYENVSPSDVLSEIDEFFASRDIDPTKVQVTSRGISERDPLTGSWTKVTWKPLITGPGVDPEALETIFRDWNPTTPPRVPTGAPRVVCAADFQIGKVSYLGGTVELAQRVRQSFESIAALCRDEMPSEIVMADLGDIIENFTNVSTQAQTNDLTLTEQITLGWRLMMEGIKLLAPLTAKLTYVAVPSNHCRVRIAPKAPAAGPHDDYGIMIAETVRDICAAHADLQHVEVKIPHTLEESLTHDAGGTVIGFVHGHQAGSAQKIGEWWKGQSHGRRNGMHLADILLAGHFHSLNLYQSGDQRWVMVAPTSDSGSDWYTNLKGEQSTPGMLTFTVEEGMWFDIEIV